MNEDFHCTCTSPYLCIYVNKLDNFWSLSSIHTIQNHLRNMKKVSHNETEHNEAHKGKLSSIRIAVFFTASRQICIKFVK